jgi:2-polyprenyl-6-methoxyphenol hydroxylase-like FAD-dependent oxidoreductase
MPGNEIVPDVLVVGAGPTGLMLANWLVRMGVRTTVIDGKGGPTKESRALVVQARSMEIYDQLGVAGEVLAQSAQARWLAPGFENRAFGRIPIGDLGGDLTPYPRIYVLEQSRNEQILLDSLHRLGGTVRWEHRLTSLGTSGTSVEAAVTGPDGDVRIRARYCVGADGSSSTVRTLRGIPFEGITNEQTFYVTDATEVRGLAPEAVNVRPGERDFLLAFPMGPRGHYRLIGVVRDADQDGELSEDDTRERLRQVFGVTYGPSGWFATYRIHHRVAAAFRDGPFFLAGDAAHVHSPVGAQGMNTGLQDAHNLAFALADVVHGRASEFSLDRYEAERQPVARRLVSTTDRLFGAVTSQRRLLQVARRWVPPLIAPVAVRVLPLVSGASRLFGYVSQIRVHYWMSERAKARGRRGRVVGRRLPWTGDNFDALRSLTWQVHAYGPADPSAVVRLRRELGVDVVEFPRAHPGTGLREGLLYLVRPDGFVAAAATSEAAAAAFGRALPDRFLTAPTRRIMRSAGPGDRPEP